MVLHELLKIARKKSPFYYRIELLQYLEQHDLM